MDWRVPRTLLLNEEVRGEQNATVLGVAIRTGLLGASDLPTLRELPSERERLLPERRRVRGLTFLDQRDWVVRALVLGGELTESDNDYLAACLAATWERLREHRYGRLETALLIAELRSLLQRPGDTGAQRDDVFAWLHEAHQTQARVLHARGGFSNYEGGGTDERATWAALGLMERFGVPESIDLLDVRASMRSKNNILSGPDWDARRGTLEGRCPAGARADAGGIRRTRAHAGRVSALDLGGVVRDSARTPHNVTGRARIVSRRAGVRPPSRR